MKIVGKDSGGFNLSEAARYVGVSRPTMSRALAGIPHRRFGKRVIISKSALDRWIEGQ